MKYQTYLFDFDGTLVDSMPSFVSVMKRIAEENGITPERDFIKIITPLGYLGTARYFIEVLGVKESEEALLARMNRYAYDEYATRIEAKEGVREALTALKERGGELHILTASPHAVLDVCLQRLSLFGLFTNVWSCDDFGTGKADVAIYRMAAERIGKPIGEILFLDDNYNAGKTAVEAGMRVCGVYDPSSSDYEEEIRAVSHHYVKDLRELLAL